MRPGKGAIRIYSVVFKVEEKLLEREWEGERDRGRTARDFIVERHPHVRFVYVVQPICS